MVSYEKRWYSNLVSGSFNVITIEDEVVSMYCDK